MFIDSLKFEITTTPTTVTVEIRSKFPQSAHNKAETLKNAGTISAIKEWERSGFSYIEYTFADPQPTV